MGVRLPCFDSTCREPVRHRLLDLNMCATHYIEALEHCAHIVVITWAEIDREEKRQRAIEKNRAELLGKIVERRRLEQQEREELTVRPGHATASMD